MFFGKRKKYRSERGFAVMLAEELLRAELARVRGKLFFFKFDIFGDSEHVLIVQELEITDLEDRWCPRLERPKDYAKCRLIKMTALVGPFERFYPENPPEDHRRKLRHVAAVVRVFTIETGCTFWRPHYLLYSMQDENGLATEGDVRYYESGWDRGNRREKDADNPCIAMVDSQIPANYPSIYPALHGGKAIRE